MIYVKLSLIAALVLCLAQMPYGYYIFVRYFAMAFFIVQCLSSKKTKQAVAFLALAVLFQPFVKIPLGREIWNVVDVLVAVGLFVLVWREYRDKQRQKADELVEEEVNSLVETNPFEPYEGIQKYNSCLVEICHNYVALTKRLPALEELPDLNGLLEELPKLKLEDSYVLDDYLCNYVRGLFRRRTIGKTLDLYVRLRSVNRPESFDFVDEHEVREYLRKTSRLEEGISEEHVKTLLAKRRPLPPREDPFKHITLPFTEDAIWQAYLLKQAEHLIGMYWHGCYNRRIFINQMEDIENIFVLGDTEERFSKVKDKLKQCWSNDKQPLVVLDGDKAYISHYWFDHWKGLVQVKCLVKYDYQQHRITDFFIKECDPVVPYHCRILF